MVEVDERWASAEAAENYRHGRWRSSRASGRDLSLVDRLVSRHVSAPLTILDVPCGTGRLAPMLSARARRYMAIDVSLEMARRAAIEIESASVGVADASRLPLADDSFDLVVCCRLLHHLSGDGLRAVVGELARVSAGWLVASYWDASSWHAWRRRWGWHGGRRPSGRVNSGRQAIPFAELVRVFEDAGLEIVDRRHSFRWISQQGFVLARKRAEAE